MTMGYRLPTWKGKLPGSRNNDAMNRALIALGMALAGKTGRHRGFVCATMGDVETMAVDSRAEGLPGFSYILETTPPALY